MHSVNKESCAKMKFICIFRIAVWIDTSCICMDTHDDEICLHVLTLHHSYTHYAYAYTHCKRLNKRMWHICPNLIQVQTLSHWLHTCMCAHVSKDWPENERLCIHICIIYLPYIHMPVYVYTLYTHIHKYVCHAYRHKFGNWVYLLLYLRTYTYIHLNTRALPPGRANMGMADRFQWFRYEACHGNQDIYNRFVGNGCARVVCKCMWSSIRKSVKCHT